MKVKNVTSRNAALKEMAQSCSWANCKQTIVRHVVRYEYRRSVSTHEHTCEDGRQRDQREAAQRPARVAEKAVRVMHLCTKHREAFGKKYKFA